ncbi:MAG: helix-turn-helix domain-containing protein, partial [Sporomusa sp.]
AHDVPYYGRKEFTPKTIQCWLRSYRSQGFAALKPKGRSDRGASRVLSPELKERVLALRQKYRLLSAMLFYETLVSEDVVFYDKVSYHTVYRLLKAQNLLERDVKPSQERVSASDKMKKNGD